MPDPGDFTPFLQQAGDGVRPADPTKASPPEAATNEKLDRLLDRQRKGWGRGEGVPVEALLANHPTLRDDPDCLLDLVWNEVDLRTARGEAPQLDEYQKRFPALSDDLRKQFEVFAALDTADQRPGHGDRAADAGAAVPPRLEGYEFLGELGRGGMGVVFKARQTALNRVVAVKMILPGAYTDAEEVRRFRAEAEAVARLQHANIIQIHHVGEEEGRPFLVLEFASGGGLDRRLAGTPLPPAEAARLVETLARAVHHAHERGVVHRDLKPSNVLLMDDQTPKITDFGLAKKLDDVQHTQTGAVLGTPSYMAPEQAAGKSKEIGPAVDVYALGAILYECLTGRPPFKAPVMLDTLMQVRNDDPVPPRQLQSKTPRDLETICLKCLQKDAKRRYIGAAGLAEDLRRYRAGEPIAARPVGRSERIWRWVRRNPKDAALAAAGLLAVVLGLVVYLWVAGVRQAAEQDRRDRQAHATAEAERKLADVQSLWTQATNATVGEALPWERALSAAQQAKDFIDDNAVDDATRQRAAQTLTGVAAAKQEADVKARTAAQDQRMTAQLDKLVFSQLELTTGQGAGQPRPELGDKRYMQVFHTYYDIDLNQPDAAEARIRASAIKPQLLAALDAWIPLRSDEAARRRLADLVNRLSEPNAFRRDLREALVAQDHDRLRQLVKRDPANLPPRVVFEAALALTNGQDYEEAAALLQPAQQAHPDDFGIAFLLAYSLGELNPPRPDDVLRFYTAAVALQPDNALARNGLGNTLAMQGKLDAAVAEWTASHRIDPTDPNPVVNLAGALYLQGKLDEAVAEYRAALPLLSGRTTEQAAVLHHNFGFTLWKQGKLEEAVAELRAAVQLARTYSDAYFHLGWALIQHGQFQEALDAFQEAKSLPAPPERQFTSWDAVIKQADRLRLLGDELDAIAEGRKQPADAQEGVEFAEVCLYKRRPAAAARLFRVAFAAEPKLAEQYRFEAERAAALAGAGEGEDSTSVNAEQRTGWRTQAREWLRIDLSLAIPKTESANPQERSAAARPLRVWQNYVDFAGVRDEAALNKLPADEQAAWRQFWGDVTAAVQRAEKP
ncbi:MAG TPA: protein kinase [Gemmataceae bacterium]|nr:protein kinase [Gemmataceae bacterium]